MTQKAQGVNVVLFGGAFEYHGHMCMLLGWRDTVSASVFSSREMDTRLQNEQL